MKSTAQTLILCVANAVALLVWGLRVARALPALSIAPGWMAGGSTDNVVDHITMS